MPSRIILRPVASRFLLLFFLFLCFMQAGLASDLLEVSPQEAAGHLVRKIEPVYPPLAKAAKIQGVVTLRVLFNKQGGVMTLSVISGAPMLVQSAVDAVQQWEYQPFMVNGEPVEAATQVQIPFVIEQSKVSCEQRRFEATVHLTDAQRTWMYRGPDEAISFSPDGQSLAVLNCDKGLAVWNLKSGQLRFSVKETAEVSSLAFHPSGRWLAFVGGDNKTVKIWDLLNGSEFQTLHGHTAEVYAIAFMQDGDRVASISRDGALRLWNLFTGRELHEVQMGAIQSAVFSSDGSLLATQGPSSLHEMRQEIKLWNVEDGRPLRTLPAGTGRGVMEFSADSALLADAGYDWDSESKTSKNGIRVYDTTTGDKIHEIVFPNQKFRPASLAFSPDGRWLAMGEDEGSGGEDVDVWETATGRYILHLRHEDFGRKIVAFSPDGQWLAFTNKDFAKGTPAGRPELEIKTVELRSIAIRQEQPDGRSVLSLREGDPNRIEALALAENGSKLASAGLDGSLRLWNAGSGHLSRVIGAGGPGIVPAPLPALSHDGKLLAAIVPSKGDIDVSVVEVWDAETGEELHTFDVPEARPRPDAKPVLVSLIFSPDGRWLALGSFCKIILLDVATGRTRRTLTVTPDPIEMLRKENALNDLVLLGYVVTNAVFSPDGRYVATVQVLPNSSLQLWDTATGKKLNEMIADPSREEHSLQTKQFGPARFSPDSRFLVTMKNGSGRDWLTGQMITYDTSTFKEIRSFPASGNFLGITTGKEGGLMMMSRDKQLQVLDVLTGKVKRTMTLDMPDSIRGLAMSSDGKWLTTADNSEGQNSIRLWDLSTGRQTVTIPGLPVRVLTWDQKPPTIGDQGGNRQDSALSLSAPELLWPQNGAVLFHHPRYTTLVWNPVPSAAGYVVEWDFKRALGWNSEFHNSSPKTAKTEDPTYSFDFVGVQSGRWRAWAVDAKGKPGPKSDWYYFQYEH
jgi:TonB family protein